MKMDEAYVKDYVKVLKKQVDALVKEHKELQDIKDQRTRDLNDLRARANKYESKTRTDRENVKYLETYRDFILEVLEKANEKATEKMEIQIQEELAAGVQPCAHGHGKKDAPKLGETFITGIDGLVHEILKGHGRHEDETMMTEPEKADPL
jgi:hypothetical protein